MKLLIVDFCVRILDYRVFLSIMNIRILVAKI